MIYIHKAAEERGGRIFHCDLANRPNARCLAVPAWMFDRAVCLGVRQSDTPQVELAALVRLRRLLAEIANQPSIADGVIGARHSFDHRGDADATPKSSANHRPARSVPLVQSAGAQLAGLAGGGARESDASHRADAEPELDVNHSIHSAPIIQPQVQAHSNARTSWACADIPSRDPYSSRCY
jgi:hypothetical protein